MYLLKPNSVIFMTIDLSKDDDRRMSKRKKIKAKLDELLVTGSLRRLIGAIPYTGNGDDDWKKEKDAYLMEKYGE